MPHYHPTADLRWWNVVILIAVVDGWLPFVVGGCSLFDDYSMMMRLFPDVL